MAIFDLDEDMIINTVASALEDVGSDVSEDQFNKIAEAINEGMPGVIEVLTYGMQEHWKNEAKASGTGWGNKYARAIMADVTGSRGIIYIDEDLVDKGSKKPNMMFVKMVEEGVKSWSIKDALLASDKAKTGPSGIRYITIPFPVRTPAKSGQGKMASKFGKREMTAAMYKIVKSGGKIKSGTLKAGARDMDITGLTRYVTRQRHSQYGIFRRVSEKSQGWQYPNKSERPVFPSVVSEVNKRVNDVLNAFMKSIVREYTT
jgi:hypothetical protein